MGSAATRKAQQNQNKYSGKDYYKTNGLEFKIYGSDTMLKFVGGGKRWRLRLLILFKLI
jgi:hypothetical protein